MYYFQQKLLYNYFGFIFCKYISKSFYNEKGELRKLWKFFSNNDDLKKVINPDNDLLYTKIKKEKNLNIWFWINPKLSSSQEVEAKLNIYSDKVYGLKFHQYWHNFDITSIESYLYIAEKKSLPIYIILHYDDPNKIYNLLKEYPKNIFIIGYGCFPLYYRIWHKIEKLPNCYIDIASNHLSKKIIYSIFQNFDKKRILFSSDCPYNFKDEKQEFSYYSFLKRIDWLSDSEKIKFLEQTI